MKNQKINLKKIVDKNNNYRKVVYTAPSLQVVVMTLKPKDFIKMEVHPTTDQFIRVEQGTALVRIGIDDVHLRLKAGDAVVIKQGQPHQIINHGKQVLKLYTIYTPPEHRDKLVQKKNPEQK